MAESARGRGGRLVPLLADNLSVTITVVFVLLGLTVGLVVDLIGFPVVSGIIMAWTVIIVAATVVFVIVPIYALGFLE